ncbi:DNA-binding response regulator [Halobacteriales archaeon QS_4_62_28]|nr:MAG: DNA-binding response regulator [Halobacteriales archaeon QS_4_62_28]
MSNAAFDALSTSDVVLVCVADDDLRQSVTTALRTEWPVRTAHDSETALTSLDDAVSVVVVDLSEERFVQTLWREDANGVSFERAALIEGPPPDLDHAGYVSKPVSAPALRETVDRLQRRAEYDRLLGQYYSLANRYADTASDPQQDPDDLARLKERLFTLRKRLDTVADSLDDVDAFDVALGSDGEDTFDDFSTDE